MIKKYTTVSMISLLIALFVLAPVSALTSADIARADTSTTTSATSTINAATINIRDNFFDPVNATINQGMTVTWTNQGANMHTVTADDGSFDSGTLEPGQTFSQTFNTPGSFPYHCSFHGAAGGLGMSGTIIVASSATSSGVTTSGTNSTSASTTPIVSSINTVPTSDGTGVTITWTTDQPSGSQILFGNSSSYNSSTSPDSTQVTNHSVTIQNLTPNTTYHFQINSSNASGMTGTSSGDQTFTTSVNNSTATSTSTSTSTSTATSTSTGTTTAPTISAILASSVTGGSRAVITWTTDTPSSSQIMYGTSTGSYPSSSTLDSNLTTNHSVMLTGLSPNLTYHFQIESTDANGNMGMSSDQVFTTTSTNGSTLDLQSLESQIQLIMQQITQLQQQLQNIGTGNNGGTTGTGTTTGGNPGNSGTGIISPANTTVSRGGSVDFTGRNFGNEESVIVTNGSGQTITTAHADGGGNFSTGSIGVPNTLGSMTYTFRGANSGITASATVTITS